MRDARELAGFVVQIRLEQGQFFYSLLRLLQDLVAALRNNPGSLHESMHGALFVFGRRCAALVKAMGFAVGEGAIGGRQDRYR